MIVPDMNKCKKPLIPKAGGIAFTISIVLIILIYIFFKTFILKTETHLLEISILMVTALLACFIGFIDDIFGWKKSLAGWQKILMTLPIAIPLMVINAGQHAMLGIDFGIFYPLLFIPLGVIGATNGYNLLAGHNGLEAGIGAIVFAVLGLISLTTGQLWLALIAGIIVPALLAFLIFNKFPAKIFPGNSLTYVIGALIACFAILGNMEKASLILFVPFIIEGLLKARSRFKADNFGIPQRDGSIELPYKRIYSLTHLIMRILKRTARDKKATELRVVNSLILIEIILAVIVLICTF